MFVQPHYPCNCCSTCQYQIQTLQTKYKLLVNDYQQLRQKDRLNSSASDIYHHQNLYLNKLKLQQQAKINLLYQQFQQIKASSPEGNIDKLSLQNQTIRRQQRKISDLNITINKKNGDLMRMKEQLQAKSYQIQKISQNNKALSIRLSQGNMRRQLSKERLNSNEADNSQYYKQVDRNKMLGYNDMQNTSDTRDMSNSYQMISNHQKIDKDNINLSLQRFNNNNSIENLNKLKRINMIQSKILQLQQENHKLRNILTTKI